MTRQQMFQASPNAPYFTIYSIQAMKSRSWSVWRANIDNTKEKRKIADDLYPESDWFVEYHWDKIDVKPVVS